MTPWGRAARAGAGRACIRRALRRTDVDHPVGFAIDVRDINQCAGSRLWFVLCSSHRQLNCTCTATPNRRTIPTPLRPNMYSLHRWSWRSCNAFTDVPRRRLLRRAPGSLARALHGVNAGYCRASFVALIRRRHMLAPSDGHAVARPHVAHGQAALGDEGWGGDSTRGSKVLPEKDDLLLQHAHLRMKRDWGEIGAPSTRERYKMSVALL
eukprot:2928810-Pleurochrysis_carterae.AAC.1